MKGKRILSAVLSAALLLQLSPLAVFAEDTSLLPAATQTALTEPAPEEPTPEPAGEETALPEEPAPEETAVPMAVPTPEPTAESTAAPAPEETAAPDAAETPAPEPSAEPTAAPDPAAAVQAMIDALPDEVTEDNAAAVEQALTDIDDAKQSLTEEELAGLDFARYDAAANALLALWGEAPTDEVEMLDAYPTPNKDDKGCYLIDSAEKLLWFANEVNTNGRTNISAKLIDDIKLNGENKVLNDDGSLISNPSTLQTWTPIGTDDTGKRFTGTFDGNNKTIRGLYINDSTKNYVGLFGCVGKNGKVIDVTLADSYVSGNMNVGGVCGKNYGGTVNGCSNNGEVTGTSNYVGGVCGKNYGGSVNGCYNTGKVTGTSSVGGVCGENNSNVAGCYNEGHVTGTWTVGGVCGNNYGGTVKGCYNTKAVTGKGTVGGVCGQNANSGIVEGCHNEGNVTGTADDGQQVGGVCGYIESGTVKKCHNDGTVTGNNFHTGGVCGQNTGKLQECSNTGEVSGTDYVGGVCGTQVSGTVQECYNTGKVTGAITGKWGCIGGVCGWNNKGTLEKSYNTNTVSGTKFVGGVCGKNNNTVNGCYNTGNVTGTEYVGGVCGSNDGTVKGCYYLDTNTKAVGSGTDGVNCASKTKLQFQNGAVAYQMQADLGETAEQVWGQKLGTDKTPVLSSETDYKVYHPTSGTSPCTGGYSNKSDGILNHQYENSVCIYCGEPASEEIVDGYYQIATADQLRQFAEKVNSGNYNINAKLTADIKLNGDNKVLNDDGSLISDPGKLKSWTPIGTFNDKFTGTFDGNGKTISGLYYNNSETDDVGLFGCVGEHGKVINVTLADSYVSGNNTVGGICGWNDGGTLQGCHNTGTVSGAYHVGGVCGINNNSGTIQKCDNAGTVSGTNSKIGGVCGSNGNGTGSSSTTIQECYNTGKVSGKSWVGGVCGQNTGGTLEKSYNTNTVTGTGNYIGGVCGDNYNSGTVNGCYNTGTVSGGSYVGGVCGENTATVENCYYLSSKSGTAHSQGGISKNLAEFNSGAVAYLLQKALNDADPKAEQVWGQNIGTDASPVLSSDTKYKVYPTAQDSPCRGYSNTANEHREHSYQNGECIYCGEPEIAYTVTIPATVELGNKATISATGVTLPDGKELNVKVATDSPFEVTLDGDTREYTVTNKGENPDNPNGTLVDHSNNTVLTAVNGNSKTVYLQFNKPETTTYSGEYKGTVKFTVSVDDKPAS